MQQLFGPILASATISDEPVPLSIYTGTWSLGDLFLMLVTVMEAVFLIFHLVNAGKERQKIDRIRDLKDRDAYHSEYRREKTYTMLSIPLAAVSMAEYCLTQDFMLDMVIFDEYTPIMVILLILQTFVVLFCRHKVLHIVE